MPDRALVTGGAGFVGSHLVDALLAAGHDVRVLDALDRQSHPTGEARFLSPDAELVVGDLRDRDAVDRALEGRDVVFHLGAMVGNGQSMVQIRRYTDVNAVGTATLLEAMVARRAQLRRLVVASSMVVYGDGAYACATHGAASSVTRDEARLRRGLWEPTCAACGEELEPVPTPETQPLRPTSTYGVTKLAEEQLALTTGRAFSLPTIALRYLNIYGSRQTLSNPYTGVAAIMTTRLLHDRRPVVFEDGAQRRDLVHVRDVAAATMAAAAASARADYQAVNVGTGGSITVAELARRIARELGKDLSPDITGEFRDGDIRHCIADVTRARDLLGWSARVSFEDGVGELVRWARGEQPDDATERANEELRTQNVLRRATPSP